MTSGKTTTSTLASIRRKIMANVIYRGPVEREPETINLPVAAALNPGMAVKGPATGGSADTTGAGSSSATVVSSARQSPLHTQQRNRCCVPR
jgi:hypothetical protein